MFDYSAGEKYRLTLVMVALAGVMAGIFVTMLFMPTPEPPRRHKAQQRGETDLSRQFGRAPGSAEAYANQQQQASEPSVPPVQMTDRLAAQSLVEQWLPLAWDLSAGTAPSSQEKAIGYMTPEAAAAYRQNVWTDQLASQIQQSGIQSQFKASTVEAQPNLNDGSVVVLVDGIQELAVPGKGSTRRQVRLEYLVKQTAEGLRIAGISERGGQQSGG